MNGQLKINFGLKYTGRKINVSVFSEHFSGSIGHITRRLFIDGYRDTWITYHNKWELVFYDADGKGYIIVKRRKL